MWHQHQAWRCCQIPFVTSQRVFFQNGMLYYRFHFATDGWTFVIPWITVTGSRHRTLVQWFSFQSALIVFSQTSAEPEKEKTMSTASLGGLNRTVCKFENNVPWSTNCTVLECVCLMFLYIVWLWQIVFVFLISFFSFPPKKTQIRTGISTFTANIFWPVFSWISHFSNQSCENINIKVSVHLKICICMFPKGINKVCLSVLGFSDITIEFIADCFFPVCLNFKTYPSCNLLFDWLSDSRRIQQKVNSSAESQNINKLIFCLHQACVNNKFYSGKKRCCISPYMNNLDFCLV